MKTYQYKPDAPASACIWRINKCTHSLARRACIGQVRFHLPIALSTVEQHLQGACDVVVVRDRNQPPDRPTAKVIEHHHSLGSLRDE